MGIFIFTYLITGFAFGLATYSNKQSYLTKMFMMIFWIPLFLIGGLVSLFTNKVEVGNEGKFGIILSIIYSLLFLIIL